MRFIPKTALTALWLLCMGFLAAPAAHGVTPEHHPSSDAPWLIGLLVLILLGAGMTFLLLKRGMSRRTKSSRLL